MNKPPFYRLFEFWLFIGYLALIPVYEVMRWFIKEPFSLAYLIQYASSVGLGYLTLQFGKHEVKILSNLQLLETIKDLFMRFFESSKNDKAKQNQRIGELDEKIARLYQELRDLKQYIEKEKK